MNDSELRSALKAAAGPARVSFSTSDIRRRVAQRRRRRRLVRGVVLVACLGAVVGLWYSSRPERTVHVATGATAQPDDLVGEWTVSESDAVRPPSFETRVVFARSGAVTLDTGCNTFSTSWSLHDGSLKLGRLMGSKVGCRADLSEWENEVTNLFSSSMTATVPSQGAVELTAGPHYVMLTRQAP